MVTAGKETELLVGLMNNEGKFVIYKSKVYNGYRFFFSVILSVKLLLASDLFVSSLLVFTTPMMLFYVYV